MPYGEAQQRYPSLAAETSLVVSPQREVWVITTYPPAGTSIPSDGGWGPPGAPQQNTSLSAVTTIVDAVTGEQIDSCLGCAYVPAPS